MVKALYMDDCYLKKFDAKVVSAEGNFVVLDQTAFYPRSGGVEHDTGILKTQDGTEYKVVFTGKFSGNISHEVDRPGLNPGDKVHGILDWQRRYLLMRYHTAAHVLSGVFSKQSGVLITGNQLTTEKGRIDFNMETFEKVDEFFKQANELIAKNLKTSIYNISRTEAEKDPDIFKLAKQLPVMNEFRIVEIKDFDRQADGGCHVKSLIEVGEIKFLKTENKGKNNRRVYFQI